MKNRVLVFVILIAGIIITVFCGFFNKKSNRGLHYRLVWFELQIAPSTYRFAIIPQQPILIGFEGENEEEGTTILIRYDNIPEEYEKIIEKVDAIIKSNHVLELPEENSKYVFSDELMEGTSIHLRIAYADNTQWAGYYKFDNLPPEIENLIRDTKTLAKQLMQEHSKNKISGDEALKFIKADNSTSIDEFPQVIVKVRIKSSGEIFVDKQKVSLQELKFILDNLRVRNFNNFLRQEIPNPCRGF